MRTEVDVTGAVVTGYDGSAGAELALEWACAHARVEGLPLVVLHASASPFAAREPTVVGAGDLREHTRRHERVLLDDVDQRLRLTAPDLDVRTVLVRDGARAALVTASQDAAAVVVGATSQGDVGAMVLGSVAQAVAKEARCPVVVVRRPMAARADSVLVGTDGSPVSEPALAFAFDLAAARSWTLRVLHCFWDASRAVGDVPEDEQGYAAERDHLDAVLAPHRERHPEVPVRLVLSRGFADRRLVQATHHHGLVVIGHHRLPFLDSVVWSNVTPSVLRQAAGNVAVVPSGPLVRESPAG